MSNATVTPWEQTAGHKRALAAACRMRAKANRDTLKRTGGRGGSQYMADLYDACADTHEQQAKEIEGRG